MSNERGAVRGGVYHAFPLLADEDRCQEPTKPFGERCLFRWRVTLTDGRLVCFVHARGAERAGVQQVPCNGACPVHCGRGHA